MPAEEESIREQLLRLLERRKQPFPDAEAPKAAEAAHANSGGSDDHRGDQRWKKGVLPLPSDGRAEPRVLRPQAQERFSQRRLRRTGGIWNYKPSRPPPQSQPSVRLPDARPAELPDLGAVDISDPTHFKAPEAWVAHGASLQPFTKGRSVMRIRLGIDFGTAFTKLAIGLAGKVFLVDWEGIHAARLPYLLSGELSETIGGTFVGRSPEAAHVWRDLKLPFVGVERRSTLADRARAATFLAWIMRYARAWLYQHHASVLRGHQLIWEVNLGSPTGSWAVASEAVRDEYRQMGLAAWRCSQEPQITLTRTTALLADTPSSEAGWGLDFLGVVPEFAAQIAGFVHSAQRKDGLYILADVGAGTLDVSCFRIVRNPATGENKFPVFASAVQPVGTHYLMGVRAALAKAQGIHWQSTQHVPSAVEFAIAAAVPLTSVKAADHDFRRLVAETVNPVLHRTRTEMDCTAPELARGGEVPVFLCGGGAHVDVYQSGIAQAFSGRAYRHYLRAFPPEAAPEARFRLDAEAAGRLSVARGLTHDAESIGKFIPTPEIPPESPSVGSKVDIPDRDELYPK